MAAKKNLEKKLELFKKELLIKKAEAFDVILKNDIEGEEEAKKSILNLELEIENVVLELEMIENDEIKLLINKFNTFHIDISDIQSFLPAIKSLSAKKFTSNEKKEAVKKVIDFINSL